jgi:DNA-binding transcriptional MerR regulator
VRASTQKDLVRKIMRSKSDSAFQTISEVTKKLSVQQHVLRFWESKFTQIKPMKRAGGRRYYRPEDVLMLERIKNLLYDDGYTIKGVQQILKKENNTTCNVKRDISQKDSVKLNSVLIDLQEIKQLLS